MKNKTKKVLTITLAFCMLFSLLPSMAFATPTEEANRYYTTIDISAYNDLRRANPDDGFLMSASEHLFEGYSINEIKRLIDEGGQIFQNLRVQYEDRGTMTYRVPVQYSEIEYLMTLQTGIQPFANPFGHTRIRYSGRPRAESIVIILIGDGFTAEQNSQLLQHANNVINAMLDTHPFGLFRDRFTVYVINATGTNPDNVERSYLGTVAAPGDTTQHGELEEAVGGEFAVSSNLRTSRVRELANAVAPANQQTMIQVISNAAGGTGFALVYWHYQLSVNIGATSIRNETTPAGGSNIVWPNGTAWHGTVIHEFGHSFGKLLDEHGDHNLFRERYANVTAAANENIKWRHWFGYRGVRSNPLRFNVAGAENIVRNWAVPAYVSDIHGQSGCLMRASWGNRDFCGVCTAELIRRMALISGEAFHGRSPVTGSPLPNTPTLIIQPEATRILDSAFHGNTSLQTIHIPASVATIGDFAFIGATGLTRIINDRVIPQEINATTFAGVNRSNVEVRIPPGTRQAYRNAGWYDFMLLYNRFPFLDVQPEHWARHQIEFLFIHGIMTGRTNNQFRPGLGVNRVEFAAALGRMYEAAGGTIGEATDNPFTDVPNNSPLSRYVRWASERGVITGIGNNLFAPNTLITREQMATMLLRYHRNVDGKTPNINMARFVVFPDHIDVAYWAIEGMAWATQTGVITGMCVGSNRHPLLMPQFTARRAEKAVILFRYMGLYSPLIAFGHTIFGDVTGDGTIGAADLQLLRAYLAGEPVEINRFGADVNGDGVIDFADVLLLQRFLAGEDVILGPQEPLHRYFELVIPDPYFDKPVNVYPMLDGVIAPVPTRLETITVQLWMGHGDLDVMDFININTMPGGQDGVVYVTSISAMRCDSWMYIRLTMTVHGQTATKYIPNRQKRMEEYYE